MLQQSWSCSLDSKGPVKKKKNRVGRSTSGRSDKCKADFILTKMAKGLSWNGTAPSRMTAASDCDDIFFCRATLTFPASVRPRLGSLLVPGSKHMEARRLVPRMIFLYKIFQHAEAYINQPSVYGSAPHFKFALHLPKKGLCCVALAYTLSQIAHFFRILYWYQKVTPHRV